MKPLLNQISDYRFQVALPESYALMFERRSVHRDADRLGVHSIHHMAKKAGIHFCVFSFSDERSRNAFMRRHGGKVFESSEWEQVVVE